MCRTALTDSPEGRAIGEEFNHAILLMIGAPYVVFGVVGAALFRGRLAAAWNRLRGTRSTRPVDPRS
jgi:hypothetical protein